MKYINLLELVLELRIKKTWNEDLQYEKSEAYKELSLLLTNEVISRTKI